MSYFKSTTNRFNKRIRKFLNSDLYKDIDLRGYIILSRMGDGSSNLTDDMGIKYNLTPFKDVNGLEYTDRMYMNRILKLTQSIRKKISKLCNKIGAKQFTDHEMNMYKRNTNKDLQKSFLNKASRDFDNGMFNTLTVSEAIPSGINRFYIVYYTFDSKKLLDVKTIIKSGSTFKIVKLPKVDIKR